MKRFTAILRPLLVAFYVTLFAATMTLTGCSADTLSGPDIEVAAAGNNGGSTDHSGDHNEGNFKNNGGSTDHSGDHNEGNF